MPVFLVPLIAWIADNLTTKAWRFAAAAFFTTSLVGVVAVLIGSVAALSIAVPSAVGDAMSILMPLDWAAQVSIIGAAHVTVYAWTIFRQAFEVATK